MDGTHEPGGKQLFGSVLNTLTGQLSLRSGDPDVPGDRRVPLFQKFQLARNHRQFHK